MAEQKRHLPLLLILTLVWLLGSAVMVVLFLPKIRDSIRVSGVIPLIEESQKIGEDATIRQVLVAFVDHKGAYHLVPIQGKRWGGDVYHDTLEALLGGPDEEAVRSGYATYIGEGTTLIGCTLSRGVLFVDLSKEFLDSPDREKARGQIRETMTDFKRIEEVVLLVEGKELAATP